MSIKLIATDMDDTLLNNHQKISPRNAAAIKAAAAQGIKVVFATGRMFISAQKYATELGMEIRDSSVVSRIGFMPKSQMYL